MNSNDRRDQIINNMGKLTKKEMLLLLDTIIIDTPMKHIKSSINFLPYKAYFGADIVKKLNK